jgi:hypothetical protein
VLKAGGDRKVGAVDLDAFTAYLGKVSTAGAPLEAPASVRIDGDGCGW